MDRRYLEENLSAFIDGELAENLRTEFERELSKHPDLLKQVEQIRQLEKMSRQASVSMPADGYFDGLAERIDAKLAREAAPAKEGALIRFFKPGPRVVAAFGTLAAIFLVVIVANKIFNPATEHIAPRQYREIAPEPAPQDNAADSFSLDAMRRANVKAPQPLKKSAAPAATKPESQPSVGDASKKVQGKMESLEAPVQYAIPETAAVSNVPVSHSVEPKISSDAKDERNSIKESNSVPVMQEQSAPMSARLILRMSESNLSLEDILPMDLNGNKIDDPDSVASRVKALLATGQYLRAPEFSDEDLGSADKKSVKKSNNALARLDDASQTLSLDSLRSTDLPQWEAENYFRLNRRSQSLNDLIISRVYIEYYLKYCPAQSREFWTSRLDTLKREEEALRKK